MIDQATISSIAQQACLRDILKKYHRMRIRGVLMRLSLLIFIVFITAALLYVTTSLTAGAAWSYSSGLALLSAGLLSFRQCKTGYTPENDPLRLSDDDLLRLARIEVVDRDSLITLQARLSEQGYLTVKQVEAFALAEQKALQDKRAALARQQALQQAGATALWSRDTRGRNAN